MTRRDVLGLLLILLGGAAVMFADTLCSPPLLRQEHDPARELGSGRVLPEDCTPQVESFDPHNLPE